ncbi:hypothetical protein K435DRAFT_872554 [Dendrothele bispora CBS 962.96]|uniref:Uncharacterized protein n=1 Tax=Dendrothele bispora (strain CBS 962.96) TaxID=1314807 RepID=A0A4S8L1E8_DENBC|nr:hypothetical protein K435DRAFT_872554 [Dendrothele bispora CBS 962.96]
MSDQPQNPVAAGNSKSKKTASKKTKKKANASSSSDPSSTPVDDPAPKKKKQKKKKSEDSSQATPVSPDTVPKSARTGKKPNGRPSIFSTSQRDFLLKRVDEYCALKSNADFSKFWTSIFGSFFSEYPDVASKTIKDSAGVESVELGSLGITDADIKGVSIIQF